jgi:hypothetical protein
VIAATEASVPPAVVVWSPSAGSAQEVDARVPPSAIPFCSVCNENDKDRRTWTRKGGALPLTPARSMVSRGSRFLVGTTEKERYPNRETALMLAIVIM